MRQFTVTPAVLELLFALDEYELEHGHVNDGAMCFAGYIEKLPEGLMEQARVWAHARRHYEGVKEDTCAS